MKEKFEDNKKVTWAEFKELAGDIDFPWLVVGDFNEVCN